MGAFLDELEKIAAVSSPAIKAPPTPGGLLGGQNALQNTPITAKKVIGKALQGTTLQKTNYTAVHTKVPGTTNALTQGQGAVPPPQAV